MANVKADEKEPLKNVSVILVGVQGSRNVGSVCRAMGNFGCNDLRLVNPEIDHLCEEALHMAVKAGHILKTARVYAGLADALADCHLSFGTTRRFGKNRERFFSPGQAAFKISEVPSGYKTALVFGREDNGLTTTELSLCQYFMTIPTAPDLPSMNIAQAVSVCLYELFKITSSGAPTSQARKDDFPATAEQQEKMLQHMKKVMMAIEYLNPQNPEHIFMTYRRIMGRAELTDRDIRILRGLWAKIEWAIAKKSPKGRSKYHCG